MTNIEIAARLRDLLNGLARGVPQTLAARTGINMMADILDPPPTPPVCMECGK